MTDKIVSCSHDRNAFVWTFNTAEARWEPNLVILRINRAALHVRWSPDGALGPARAGSNRARAGAPPSGALCFMPTLPARARS